MMTKLIFLLDGNIINEYILDKERTTIGRRPSNDVHIDNLAVSGEHAAIIKMGEDAYIEDLNSTNGTLVNKEPIKKQLLKHGDEIDLGKYSLKFIKDAHVNHAQANGFADTVLVEPKVAAEVVEPERDEQQLPTAIETKAVDSEEIAEDSDALPVSTEEAEPEAPQPEEGAVLSPRLQILNGENAGNALLLDKSMVKIGQSGDQVAVVTKRQEGYFITHVSGDNFPLINGKEIGAHAYALNNHDEIEVMDIKMEFCLD